MPLIKSGSKKAISANIRAEKAAGKPQDQAVAIALDVARRSRRKAEGGTIVDARDAALKEMARQFKADKEIGTGYKSRDMLETKYISDSVPRANARKYASGGAPRIPGPSFFQRDANRALSRQSGLIKSVVPGRTDKHPMRVASGSYILPADHVSALGQNNTLSGAKFLRRKFGMGGGAYADGGEVSVPVDVILAGGEYVLSPDQVRKVGGGDIKRGHQRLDDWVLETRKNHIKTLRNLKPPKRS